MQTSALSVLLLMHFTSSLMLVHGTRGWSNQKVPGRSKIAPLPVAPGAPVTCAAAPPTFTPASLDAEQGVLLPATPLIMASLPGSIAGFFYGGAAMAAAVWNAFAPFHPEAKRIFDTGIRRQPASAQTLRNQNTAIAYALLTVARSFGASNAGPFVSMLKDLGLDPSLTCGNLTNPACVGRRAALRTVAYLAARGANADGCVGKKVKCAPFFDYSQYVPKNTEYNLKDIQAWQPLVNQNGGGTFQTQVFGNSYFAFVGHVTLTQAQANSFQAEFKVPTLKQYKEQADAVLAASTLLKDDKVKMLAEFVDNTDAWANTPLSYFPKQNNWSLTKTVAFFMFRLAQFDSDILVIRDKRRYDTVRPQSAIRYIYGDTLVTAYAGPAAGVTKLPGNEFTPYAPTAPEPEYPSGAVCGCTVAAEWIELFVGKNINLPKTFKQGCSFLEPGITPKQDINVVIKTTYELIEICKLARQTAGMHFPAATEGGQKLCSGVAKTSYAWLKGLLPSL